MKLPRLLKPSPAFPFELVRPELTIIAVVGGCVKTVRASTFRPLLTCATDSGIFYTNQCCTL